jgi:hypothetical protein
MLDLSYEGFPLENVPSRWKMSLTMSRENTGFPP